MNGDQLDDLKQFITSTISQTEKRLQGEMGELRGGLSQVETSLSQLRQEMVDGFAGVGETIEEIHKQLDERDTEINKRLAKLEQQAA